MFTGIITAVSPILSLTPNKENRIARIQTPKAWKLKLGQSVAIDGVCSTISKVGKTYFEVVWMPETLENTIAAAYAKGAKVNLERPLTLKDFVDGHLVQGHVDSKSAVTNVLKNTEGTRISGTVPRDLQKFIAKKGSVAVNGVSLTVTDMRENIFTVALIPYTLKHTNLGRLQPGDLINIEVDLVARYIHTHAEKK